MSGRSGPAVAMHKHTSWPSACSAVVGLLPARRASDNRALSRSVRVTAHHRSPAGGTRSGRSVRDVVRICMPEVVRCPRLMIMRTRESACMADELVQFDLAPGRRPSREFGGARSMLWALRDRGGIPCPNLQNTQFGAASNAAACVRPITFLRYAVCLRLCQPLRGPRQLETARSRGGQSAVAEPFR